MIQFVLFTKQMGIRDFERLFYDTIYIIYKAVEHSRPGKSNL